MIKSLINYFLTFGPYLTFPRSFYLLQECKRPYVLKLSPRAAKFWILAYTNPG